MVGGAVGSELSRGAGRRDDGGTKVAFDAKRKKTRGKVTAGSDDVLAHANSQAVDILV